MEAAVVEGFEEQAQEVGERERDGQSEGVGLCLQRVSVHPPGHQQDHSVCSDEGVVDDAPDSSPTLRYIKPAEVPNEPHGDPVEPLAACAVHELCVLLPRPQHKDETQQQEVDRDVPGQNGSEQGERRHTRCD